MSLNITKKIYHDLNFLRLKLKYLVKYRTTDFFDDIIIEINTSCNRRCSYCPNSKFERSLKKNERLMDEALFKKIIDELADIDFSGRISPHRYGDPLMDERLNNLLTYVRKKLPKANIRLLTNGDLLTDKKFEDLKDIGINSLYISQEGHTISENISRIIKNNNRSHRKIKMKYQNLNEDKKLSDRAGLVKVKKRVEKPSCKVENKPIEVDVDGNVLVCPHDYFSRYSMGNLKCESLLDIWNKRKFREFRNNLRSNNFPLEICKTCLEKNS